MQLMYNDISRIHISTWTHIQPQPPNMTGETNHPLGLTVLEIRDTVEGYASLSEHTVLELMNAEDLHEMTHSMQTRVLGHVVTSPRAVVAEVSGSALVVTHRWVVSIHGDSLAHCIDALLKYRNAVAIQLAATVTGVLQTPVVDNTGPLREVVMSRQKKVGMRDNVKKVGWTLAGAIAGAVLGVLGGWIVGG